MNWFHLVYLLSTVTPLQTSNLGINLDRNMEKCAKVKRETQPEKSERVWSKIKSRFDKEEFFPSLLLPGFQNILEKSGDTTSIKEAKEMVYQNLQINYGRLRLALTTYDKNSGLRKETAFWLFEELQIIMQGFEKTREFQVTIDHQEHSDLRNVFLALKKEVAVLKRDIKRILGGQDFYFDSRIVKVSNNHFGNGWLLSRVKSLLDKAKEVWDEFFQTAMVAQRLVYKLDRELGLFYEFSGKQILSQDQILVGVISGEYVRLAKIGKKIFKQQGNKRWKETTNKLWDFCKGVRLIAKPQTEKTEVKTEL